MPEQSQSVNTSACKYTHFGRSPEVFPILTKSAYLEAAALACCVPIEDAISKSRSRVNALPRHIAVGLMRADGYSWKTIGRTINRKSHKTVTYGFGRISALAERNVYAANTRLECARLILESMAEAA